MTTKLTLLPSCPERLTTDEINRFREEGYLAFDGLLSREELETARERLKELVRETAAESAQGSVLTRRDGGRFHVQLEPGTDCSTLSAEEVELKVRKLMWYCDVDPFFSRLAEGHPRLRGVLESLLGAGAMLFQDMALVKPPLIGSEKPWHQDNAYFAVTPLEQVVGVWIALDAATVENGCMHVIPGGHREGARRHHHTTDCTIVPERLDAGQAVPIPLPAGGVLFFMGMLPHQTPPNRSSHRRRALQFHYRGADTTTVSREVYDTIFNDHGEPASCAAART